MKNKPKCKKCGRPLRDPISISIGLGPKCRGEASQVSAQAPAAHKKSNSHAYRPADTVSSREQALLAGDALTIGRDPITKQPNIYKPDGQGNYIHNGSTISRESLINYMKHYGFIHSSIVANQH